MKICRYCGEENPDNKNWCKKCMKPLRDDPAEALPLDEESVRATEVAEEKMESSSFCILKATEPDAAPNKKSQFGIYHQTEPKKESGRIHGSMGPKNRDIPEEKPQNPKSEKEEIYGLRGSMGPKEYVNDKGRNSRIIHQKPKRHCINCGQPIDGEDTLCPKCRKRKKKTKTIWLRVVAAVLVVAMWSSIAVYFVVNRTPKVKNAEQAISVLKDLGEEWGYENAFSELTEKNTTTIDGDTYYRLQQNYRGIPVYGRTIVYTAGQNGNVTSITSNIADVDSRIELTPSVTKTEIYEAINAYTNEFLGVTNEWVSIPTFSNEDLVVYVLSEEQSALAYQLIVYIESEPYRIVIDAHDTNIYEANSLTMTDYIPVEYKLAPNAKTVRLNICTDNNKFSFYDEVRNIELYSAHGEKLVKYFAFYDSNDEICFYFYPDRGEGGCWLNAAEKEIEKPDLNYSYVQYEFDTAAQIKKVTPVYESSVSKLPDSAYQTMTHLAITHDFFTDRLSRRGYANDDTKFLPVVYNCSNGSYACIDFGISMISLNTEAGMDSVAHEFMHCVEQNESSMCYSSESGAIMEALSDIFGELVESYYYGYCDWLHHGNSRNIINPSLSTEAGKAHPSVYLGTDWVDTSDPCIENDFGGVHINSTVISHAAYLMWLGGAFPNIDKQLSEKELAELWYRAMLMMPSDCNFVECRTLVELAASTMNLTDMQKQCVCEAFDAVGIPRASEEEYSELVHLVTDGETAIKGTVYEVKTVDGVETVVPVSKAMVTVYDENSSKVYKKLNMKNKDGFFEIELPAGTYSVSVTVEGYIGQNITFELDNNEVRYLSFAMEPVVEEPTEAPTVVPTETTPKDDVLSGKCGDNLTWTLKNGVLTISGTGAMYDYDLLSFSYAPWYEYREQITELKIGSGVKNIGNAAFFECVNLRDVVIPGNVKCIGEDAFSWCGGIFDKNLYNVTIEPGVERIERGAFHEGFPMVSIDLPDSITYIGDAAFFCCYLENITIPPNVTYMGGWLFQGTEVYEIEEIHFTGDVPEFADYTFIGVDVTAYYPANNKTWTPDVLKDYGGNVTWIAEGKTDENEKALVAYRPIAEKYNVSSQEQSYGWYSGTLIDLDNDNVQELVLRYLSAPFEDAWWSEHKLSVYDYENGKVVTKLDGVTFGEIGGAGEDAYATILYKSGKPYIMTYNAFGPTSSVGSMKPDKVGTMIIYDGKTCKEVGVYRIERENNVMTYKINQKTVSEKKFVNEIEQYQGVDVICDLYQLIEFPETFVTVTKLLQQMK